MPTIPDDQSNFAKYGGRCPLCQGVEQEGEAPDIDNEFIRQRRYCLNCRAQWTARYIIDGYEDLEDSIGGQYDDS